MRECHPKLWNDLVALGYEKNTISKLFNREETILEIEERFMWEDAQMDLFKDGFIN